MKKSTKAWSIVVIIVALGAALWLGRSKKAQAPAIVSVPAPSTVALDWNTQIPSVTKALDQAFSANDVGTSSAVSIVQQGDVTGDGIPDALVDLGSGGASTDDISLVYIYGGQVTVAKIQGEDGTIAPLEFPQGSASAHADSVALDPDTNTVYHGSVDYGSDGSIASCTVDAYQWNSSTQIFDYTASGSADQQQTFCASVADASQ